MADPIVVEYVTGEHVETYWQDDCQRLYGVSADEQAARRIAHLKRRWGLDARIRSDAGSES